MSSETLKSITINQLRVGVFVSKLDIVWLDSPFLSNKRLIKTVSEIESLRSAGVKQLTIDLSKGLDGISVKPPQEKTEPKPAVVIGPSLSKTHLDKEIGAALAIRNKIQHTLEALQQALKSDSQIPITELTPLVDETLDSLKRNNQALLSLVHISRKSQKLADHSFGTFCLSLNLALAGNATADELKQLGLAALLHESGWASLPLNLMGKRTPYSKSEAALVRNHTLISDQSLSSFDLPDLTRRLISEHHERLDGSGYPRGLKGEQIHPLAQLLSIVDAYEERVHQLADKPGMLPTNALKSLYKDAEMGKFESQLVAALIATLGIYPPTTAILLNTGEKGVVKEVHANAPLLPVIAIYYDKSGLAFAKPVILDLLKQGSQSEKRTIQGGLDVHAQGVDPAHLLAVNEGHFQ